MPSDQGGVLEAAQIMELLPHRYPFLLVDRVLAYELSKSLQAIKNVTCNEPYFTGHFPDRPVMPGVMIIEALAQACGILMYLSSGYLKNTAMFYFAGIDNARFKHTVKPGDQLRLDVELLWVKRDIAKFSVVATVTGKIACKAELLSAARRDVNR